MGSSYTFYPHLILGVILSLLCCTRGNIKCVFIGIVCACSALAYTHWRHPSVVLPQEKMAGAGIFHIEKIKPYASFFNRSILYKGILKTFQTEEGTTYTNLPCQIYLPLQGKKNPGDKDYLIAGTLCQKEPYSYVLKPDKKTAWEPVKSAFNLAQWRFETKQTLFSHLKIQIKDPLSSSLLYSLISGEVDERILSLEFKKIGLQHMLAVSGFHFALLALFLNTLLRLLFPSSIRLCLLILCVSLYYLFVGDSPAIQRAYIAIVLVTIGKVINFPISGINALGVGLLVEIVLKPLQVLDLGFQFSFLCTFAILLLYPLAEKGIQMLFLKRSYKQILQLSILHQHAYLVCSLLRSTLSLNLAVHFISMPVLLYLFHKFPLISLAYNLIFPFCISFSMILLFSALLMDPIIPLLGHWIHSLNNQWTSLILSFTSNPPAALDFCLRSNALSLPWILFFILCCFFVGTLFYEKENESFSL